MRHRRGIALAGPGRDEVVYIGPLAEALYTTFEDIREWQTLGAHCGKCEREGWLLRWELQQKWGAGTYIGSLTGRLRCRACGNKKGNTWIVGQLPR